MHQQENIKKLAPQVNDRLLPFSPELGVYDKIKMTLDILAESYVPPKKHIDGDLILRFPEYRFILRTEGRKAAILVNVLPDKILLDFSFKNSESCLKFIKNEIKIHSILLNGEFKINSRIDLNLFRHILYYARSFSGLIFKAKIGHKNGDKGKIKNVLVLQGSPRGKLGYTDKYLSYFIAGFDKAINVEVIHVYEKNIEYCKACFSCKFKNGGICQSTDDTNCIFDKIKESDLILLAFPILTGNMPGKLKSLVEKWFAFSDIYRTVSSKNKMVIYEKKQSDKKQYLCGFIISGHPDKNQFTAAVKYMELLAEMTSTIFLGNILIPDAVSIDNNPREELFREKVRKDLSKLAIHLTDKPGLDKRILKNLLGSRKNSKNWVYWSNIYTKYLLAQNKITTTDAT